MAHRLTAPGEAALAVFALGADERHLLARLGCAPPPQGRPVLRRLALGEGLTEEALVLGRADGSTELHVHGGPRLAERVAALLGCAARAPEPDAATRTLLHAAVPELVLLALAQRGEGGLPALLARARRGADPALAAALREAAARGREAAPYLEPRSVVLRGATNAGKSTLFNLLVGRERVRSGPEPGLTRDSVEELVVLDGLPLRLIDSAGDGSDAEGSELDRAAQALAEAEERDAALVLAVGRCDRPAPAVRRDALRVWTHADHAPAAAAELRARGELAFDLLDEGRRGAAELRCALAAELRWRLAPLPCPVQGACPLDVAQRAELERLLADS